jgi:peptidoglycan/LPS O-acetylase OafA/YrhL
METASIADFINGNIPEILLLVGGLIALLIVYTYVKDKHSKKYKLFMILGVIFGALTLFLTVTEYAKWEWFAALVVSIMGFTLVIRPFKEIHFAVIGAILIMVLVYIFLGGLSGTALETLASGTPRIIAALVVGAIAYMIMHFVESVIKLFGKLFNWWPLLLVLALICILESILMFTGYGSLYDFVTGGN